MRVVAGEFKGRSISAPHGESVRPTQDRVREALFSMLGSVEGLTTLDLFAGSGALGIEARSRGAGPITFVDSDRAALRTVEDNLTRLGIEDARTFRSDAMSFLKGAARHQSRWDLVFLDPPYKLADRLGPQLAELLEPVLAAGARVVCEGPEQHPLRIGLPLEVERRYGDTMIVIHESGVSDAT